MRAGVAALIIGGALVLPIAGASAADIGIPLDTVIANGVAEGETVRLAHVSSNDLVGKSCLVRAVHGGVGRPHPGNDLIVGSGDATVTLPDVEREPAVTTDATEQLVLAETIVIELLVGPDQHFDGDIDVTLDCDAAGPDALRAVPERADVTDDGAGSAGFELPFTGGTVGRAALLGVGVLGAAAILLAIARRRPTTTGSPGP